MSQSQSKRQRKILRQAAQFRKEVRKQWTRMALLAIVCLVAIIAYFSALFAGILKSNPLEQVICLIIAVFIGMLSVRATQSSRRYESYLQQEGLTKREVNEFVKSGE